MALTITFVLRDFAEWTSIPGPIQIIYALNSFIRFLWVIIWLALFGVFVYEFYLIIDKVLKLDSGIDISFDFLPLVCILFYIWVSLLILLDLEISYCDDL